VGGTDKREASQLGWTEEIAGEASQDTQLADAAMALLGCKSEDDVYGVIGEFMLLLAPGSIVVVDEITPDMVFFITRKVVGADTSMVSQAAALVGFEMVGKRWAIPPVFRDDLLKGTLLRIPGGFAELAAGEIPRPIAAALTKALGIRDLFAIGIADGTRVLGNFAVVTRTPDVALPIPVVESFARHCYSTLDSIRKDRELAESEEGYSALVQQSSDGIVVTDEDGAIAVWNSSAASLTGIDEVVAVGSLIWEIQARMIPEEQKTPELLEQLQTGFKSAVESPTDWHGGSREQEIVHADGTRRVVKDSSFIVRTEGAVRFCSILRDITADKQAEDALKESNERFRAIVGTSPVPMALNDEQLNITLLNPAFVETLGYAVDDIPTLSDWWPKAYPDPEYRQWVAEAWDARIAQAKRSGDAFEPLEVTVRCKNSTTKTMLVSAASIVGAFEGEHLVVLYDISNRKQEEEAVVRANRLLESSLECQKDAIIFSIDTEYRYLYFNKAHANSMRSAYGTKAATGESVLQLITSDEDRVVAKENYDRALAGESHTNVRVFGDVERTYYESFFNPVLDDSGEIIGATGMARDVTARSQAEEDLRVSYDMITNLTAQVPGVVYQYRLYPDGSSAFPFSSPGMNDIYEYSPEEVREDATPVFGRIHPDDYDRVSSDISESARTLGPFHCEFRVVLPRQGLRWRFSDAVPQRMDDGGTLWYGIISDSTERVLAEENLRRVAALLEKIGEMAKVGGWELDLRTNELYWSPETYRIHEVDPTVSPSVAQAQDYYAPAAKADLEAMVQAAIECGTPWDYELPMTTAKGQQIWVRGQGLAVMEDGEATMLRGSFQDITRRKADEFRLRDLADERERNLEKIAGSLSSLIDVVSRVVEARDPYTAGHERRVSELAVRIAEEMGLSAEQADDIRVAALVHDVGKVSVPAEILSKPGRLSEIEFKLIKGHSEAGFEILSSANMERGIAEMVYQHHERCDGSGYPRGLSEDEMLEGAKVLAVADVVEAMVSHRPYRAGLGVDAALAEIERGAGLQYDTGVSEICVRVFREDGFEFSQV